MKKIISASVVLLLIGLILSQQLCVRRLETKLESISSELDNITCRIMDNSERLFYLEQEVGTSYGEAGEY